MALAKRYRPYVRQSRTQGQLRYGAEGEALDLLKRDARDDLLTTSRAQSGAADLISESARAAGPKLGKIYQDAGLTDAVRQSLASNPAARRLAETMAAGQSELEMRQVQAREGAAFAISQAVSRYSKDVSRINERKTSLAREKGLFTSDLLGQLIGEDRDAVRAARAHRADQDFTAEQNALGRGQSDRNSIRSSGIDPDSGKPIPGGPKDKKARKPTGADREAAASLGKAMTWLRRLDSPGARKKVPSSAKRRSAFAEVLTAGDRESGVPAIPQHVLAAALDMHFAGRLSPQTVKMLRDLGIQVRRLPGVKMPGPRPGSTGAVQAPGPNGQSRPG